MVEETRVHLFYILLPGELTEIFLTRRPGISLHAGRCLLYYSRLAAAYIGRLVVVELLNRFRITVLIVAEVKDCGCRRVCEASGREKEYTRRVTFPIDGITERGASVLHPFPGPLGPSWGCLSSPILVIWS